ncbi:hypothetical protein [Methanobrevibacter sp.]|uniref:hypothetical protein n=1 Tax=Methanobrevibacter sp. TaxID=66852 RepID=UPI003867DD79
MKKRYILILGLIFALAISGVSAAENGTDIVKEQACDLMGQNQQEIGNLSASSESEAVSVASENSSNNVDDGQILGMADGNETLAVPLTNDVLNTTVTVTPLASSYYKEPTKKERTFSIGRFKAVLTPYQYKKLYMISSTEDKFFVDEYIDYDIGDKYAGYYVTSSGLRYTVTVKTNKYIKVKVKIGNSYKIRKTRAKMIFSYGEGQCGVAYRHMVFLTHKYANPGYDYSRVLGSAAKYFGKCKCSPDFTKLNKCGLRKCSTVYKKYAIH